MASNACRAPRTFHLHVGITEVGVQARVAVVFVTGTKRRIMPRTRRVTGLSSRIRREAGRGWQRSYERRPARKSAARCAGLEFRGETAGRQRRSETAKTLVGFWRGGRVDHGTVPVLVGFAVFETPHVEPCSGVFL